MVQMGGTQRLGSVIGLQAGGGAGVGVGVLQPKLAQSGGGLFEIGGAPGLVGVPLLPAPGDDTGAPGSMTSHCMCMVTLVTTGMRPSPTSFVWNASVCGSSHFR